jgi:hypothetical protein
MNETPREKWRRPTRSGSGGYVACYGPVSPDPVQEEPAAAITRVVHDYACGCEKQWPVSANYEQMQDAIASALSRGGWVQLTDEERATILRFVPDVSCRDRGEPEGPSHLQALRSKLAPLQKGTDGTP